MSGRARRWTVLGGVVLLGSVVAAVRPAREWVENTGGAALGYLEVAGLRMPDWHPYQSQVSATLTRGSRVDAQGVRALHARGFKGIVNLTRENFDDEPTARELQLAFLRVPIIDNTAPSLQQMKVFLDFATEPAHQPVYVHCEAGIGRTGVAVAVYRMAVEGWTVEQALEEANRETSILPCQRDFLRDFARRLAAGEVPGYPLRLEGRHAQGT